MTDSLLQLQMRTLRYACMQRESARLAQDDPDAMRQHITRTLCRCLPGSIVTPRLVEDCQSALRGHQSANDPMYTGAIHAFAAQYLLNAAASCEPLMQRLHRCACRYFPSNRDISRDDLRLVTLAALYEPCMLPPGIHTAFVRHRLGLTDGVPRSCEEIAAQMHKPLVYIHELEAAVLTVLSSRYTGGSHA